LIAVGRARCPWCRAQGKGKCWRRPDAIGDHPRFVVMVCPEMPAAVDPKPGMMLQVIRLAVSSCTIGPRVVGIRVDSAGGWLKRV